MPVAKRSKRKDDRVKVGKLKTRELTGPEQKRVKGGMTPTPGGPIPIPYPNVSRKPSGGQ